MTVAALARRFEQAFEPTQAAVLAEVVAEVRDNQVKAADFTELKGIVARLAVAQERTEVRLEQLAVAQERTEVRLEQLAVAQERTEARLEQLAMAQECTEARLEKLAVTVTGMNQELGGLSRGMSFALENEAYRRLPALLEAQHGITVSAHFMRTEISGVEINFLARGERAGHPVILVGECKLQLDERRANRREIKLLLDQFEHQAEVAQPLFPDHEVIRLVVTHYARAAFLQRAREHNVVVVQSFEW
jgi:hypothetical protein